MEKLTFVEITEDNFLEVTQDMDAECTEYIKGERELGMHFYDNSPICGCVSGMMWFKDKHELFYNLCNGSFMYMDYSSPEDYKEEINEIRKQLQENYEKKPPNEEIFRLVNSLFRNTQIDWLGTFEDLYKYKVLMSYDPDINLYGKSEKEMREELIEKVNEGVC
ncbi:hypothetical protein KMW28_12940 [Flammeovirga yaeyamensis]|uniref:Uncharacterized protein n=1 Tax=Flammeovirga yaeyamensis TaxID=367791 RepID=A0AAX1N3Z6_9BACT|nr:hypothetical protein [Flammeovirga yaeyamensis]MBB3695924.1 hypothetical protein [Flammeovirga yaeyamensis]NMF34612.1 hypothetical protein [Flammeovirga yaeyamensis]QWG00558.1 hypothetical protein KMW28_12940 [Flammeovirga yaeyamensis]